MSNLQIVVLAVTVLILLLLVVNTFGYRAPISIHIESHDRSVCPVCWRDYGSPTILRYHLEGRDGEGQHGRIHILKPLENDGEDCVRKELQ